MSGDGEFTAMFVSSNRGKRSVALDLKQPAALEALRRLIATSDVLVQNFRPGTMERLGLGEPALRAANPGLIYVSISGVGETGPYVKKRVYDPVIQSLSGFADIQADQQTGRPNMIRTIVADKTTAVYAAQAVCAALVARGRTGHGQHIRLSMLDTMVAFLWPEAMTQYTIVGRENAPQPAPRPDLIFKTRDGYITVGSLSDSEWKGLCHVINRPDWISDPRFRSPGARSQNAAERLRLVGEILATGHSQDWLDRLDAAEVPCAPVLRRAEIMNDPQVINNELIELIEQPTLGTVRQPRPAARFDHTPARIAGPAPRIGEHTDTILSELGCSDQEIEKIKPKKPPG
jgi:crotonobetainyl-CoA:carnitine CoA-transferase CaiB-like acyl-CoA transferase